MSDPLILVRGVHFAATLLAGGTVGLMALVGEPAEAKLRKGFAGLRRQFTALIWLALAVATISGAAWLVLLASDILGTSLADVCLHGGAWPVLFDTRFGLVSCARLVLALLLGLLVLRPTLQIFQLAAAAGLLALPALVGHAGATPGIGGDVHLIGDMAHLLAAGAWLGGLPAFAWLLWRARRAANPAWSDVAIQATRRFSWIGILSVGTLLVSGLTNSWYLLSGPRDLFITDYGRLVAFKIGLFVAMISIAAVNRFYLTPRLPKPAASRALQRNSIAETCLGLGVLLCVAMLGTLPPVAHKHVAPGGIPPEAAFVHIHTNEVMADVTINPGHAGSVDVTIRLSREDMTDFPAKDVRLVLEPPNASGQAVERETVEQADGTWFADGIKLEKSGIWTVRVTAAPESGAPIPLDAPIVIER